MFGAARTLFHCGSRQLEVLEVSVSVEDPDISHTADIRGLTLLIEAGGETAYESFVLGVVKHKHRQHHQLSDYRVFIAPG